MNKIQECLLSINVTGNLISTAVELTEPKDHLKYGGLEFTLGNYLLIMLCSFTEAWEHFEKMGFNPKVKIALKIASPAIDRIKKWKGIKKLRSALLAHPSRDSYGSFVTPWELIQKYNSPTAYGEQIFLACCAIKATNVIHRYFQQELIEALHELDRIDKDIETKGISTIGDVIQELKKVDEEMTSIEVKLTEKSINSAQETNS